MRRRRKSIYAELPDRQYQILYADPPWDYKGQTQHSGKGGVSTGGAVTHYPTLTLSQLKHLNIRSITSEDALLFLWSTNPHLIQAMELGQAWGFQWATVGFVWDKTRVNPGFYTMSQCELCLIFKRGRIPRPRGKRNIRQYVKAERTEHSRKPAEVRRRIEEMFPEQSKIELFTTEKVKGWDTWGA